MKVVYIQSSYSPNNLIGSWFRSVKLHLQDQGGNAWMAIKFRHGGIQSDDIVIGDSISCGIHNLVYQYTGLQDFFSYFDTKKFLHRLDEIKPDVIHCHIINDLFLNIGLFSEYVNKHNIPVVWTFHDARVMTGQCPCPEYNGCDQWKRSCKVCPKFDRFLYPEKEWINLVSWVHQYRKRTIGHIKHLTIVTPSRWMASLVEDSYLKDKRCHVINNGIDLGIFHPIGSDVRLRYGIENGQKLLLCVANPIGNLKGRDYLERLSLELPEDYKLVMVGCLPEDVSRYRQKPNVIALPAVDRNDLVAFYSTADLFVYPSLADNFPTVVLEAEACGCPVVAFDSEGISETVAPRGKVVPRKNYVAWKNAILNYNYVGAREDAILFANQFSKEKCIQQYIELYNSVLQ